MTSGDLSVGVFCLCIVCLPFVWFWWFRIGRRQGDRRTGRIFAALIYSTLLPLPLLAFGLPMCKVPWSYVLTGLPFVAVGLLLALRVPERIRWFFIAYALASYVWFAAMLPISPTPCRG